MTITTRRLAALAAPALLVASLSACGAGGPPTDASTEAFCDAYQGPIEDAIASATEEGGATPDGGVFYDAVQEQVTGLEETGTPEDISEEAREGFEIYIDTVPDVDEDDFVEAVEGGEEPDETADLSDDEEEKATAFTDYAEETCGGI